MFLISVIIPNYNHAKFLKQRIESVLNQTYQDFELIILDDCSNDNSKEIIEQYRAHPKVASIIYNEVNSGSTFKQWKKGLSNTKGEYIWIAEADDYCELNFLEELVKPLLADKDLVLAYCQSNRVNGNGVTTGNWITHTEWLKNGNVFLSDFSMSGNEFVENYLIEQNVIPNASAVVFKKNEIDINVEPEFRYCGDWMYYFKLIVNKKIAFVSRSLNNFRYHSNSVIANAVKSENRIKIIDIELKMRKALMEYFNKEQIAIEEQIKYKNNLIVKGITYEKAILLLKSGHKIKGLLLFTKVISVYFKKKNFSNRIINKTSSFFRVV